MAVSCKLYEAVLVASDDSTCRDGKQGGGKAELQRKTSLASSIDYRRASTYGLLPKSLSSHIVWEERDHGGRHTQIVTSGNEKVTAGGAS